MAPTARVLSISVGMPRDVGWAGSVGRTSIAKTPVDGPVMLRRLGPDGDRVSDTAYHGGIDQAVYAYAREDLDHWGAELGAAIGDGGFGENLTTVGIDLNAAVIGTRWRVGEAVLEISSVRTPCNTFKNWMSEQGYDDTHWVRRFAAARRPGPYLRVVEEGVVRAGDAVVVEHVPTHGVSVVDMFIAMNLDRARLPELSVIDDLAAEPARLLAAHVARSAGRVGRSG